jgi:Protein of unknown function (DUF3649)
MKKPASVPLNYRLGVLSRCLAASLGGYALASAGSAFIGITLPGSKASAAVSGMMLGFVLYLVAVLWVFACRSARKAWLGLVVATLVLGVADLALYRMSTP